MKRSVLALLLSVCTLLPACGDFFGSSVSFNSFSVVEENGSSLSSSQFSSLDSSESHIENSISSDEFNSVEDSFFQSSTDSSVEAVTHIDEDDDGACDDCGTQVAITFDFFALNDLHGKFEDTQAQEGVDELTTYLKTARATNENTIVLSSGDMWQGSASSNSTKGAIITEWMNELDFACMTLGNHEYDWGEEFIEKNLALAEFPFLAINVYEQKTNQRADYCKSSVMVEQNGVKIGIIGAIGDCYSSISADMSSDIYFKTGSELTTLVKEEAAKLRVKGADFIVYSLHGSHQEENEYDAALSNGYVDLVFEGHTHQDYVVKDDYGVYHLQNGGDNDGVSHVEVSINYVTGTTSVLDAEFVPINVYSSMADDPIVDRLMEKYAEQIAITEKVLGNNVKLRKSKEILSLCASLYLTAGEDRWDEYDIVLGGGFMSARAPYEIPVGTVTYGDLLNILPFDNQLVLCSVLGRDLKKNFIETDNYRYYISYGEYGNSVKNDIDDYSLYYIVTDTYTSTYRYNNLREIERYDEKTFARDLLATYIQNGGFSIG